MIPIRDTIPCHCRPVVTWTLMAMNAFFFLIMLLMTDQQANDYLYRFGLVAARYRHPDWAAWTGYSEDYYFSFITSMFLHGGWLHLIMNLWFMWIFADNIEDCMGRLRFMLFYLTCGLVAALCQFFFSPDSTVPVVGASGAIAGIMGAYFMLYPYARIVIWVPLLFLPLFFEVPAIGFLGVWVIIQLHKATTSLADQSVADVAWWGHLGGFLAGVVLHGFFVRATSLVDNNLDNNPK